MKKSGGTIRGGFGFLLAFAVAVVAMFAVSGNAVAATGVSCAPTGMETVSTPRDHFQAGEVATISGGGYANLCDVQIDVERPDGVVESFQATTDVAGDFTLDYQVPPPPGVVGQYRVVVRGLDGAELASTTFEDAPAPQFDIAPSHVPTTGSRVFTAVIRNTASASADTARCIRMTTPGSVAVTSATFTVAGAGTTGPWTLTTGANFVQIRTGGAGIFGSATTSNNWVRFEITANATAAGTNTWTARMTSTNADCGSGGSSDQLGVSVAQVLTRQYTADFRDGSNSVIPAPTVVEDTSQAYRIRITRTAGSDDLQHIAIVLPTCFTGISGVSTTDSGPPAYTAELTDNMFRLVPSTKLAANGQWVQVHFTATADCPTGAHEFRTASWKNTSPETAQGDIYQLAPGSFHPALTVLSANVAPTVAANNSTVSVDEGQTATNGGTWADANLTDTVTLSASVGAVTKSGMNAGGTWSWSYATTDGPAQTQVVTITANDGTTSSSTTFQLDVNNVAPSATFNAPPSVSEGSSIAISMTSPSDPSSVDTAAGFEHRFSCDDGDTWTAWSPTGTASCSTDDSGTRNVKGEIRDQDSGTNTYDATVTVANIAPSATFNAPESANEGSSIALSLTDPSDPSPADTTAGFEYRFSCDGDTWTAWSSSNGASCSTDDSGTRNVKGEIRDKDGGTNTYDAAVTVANLAPSAAFNAPESVTEGSAINVSLTDVVDPGTADTHEHRFSCDGGSTWTTWSASSTASCATTDNGTVEVRGQVRDDDGGTSEVYSESVMVTNIAPTATFNAPESVNEGSNIDVSLTNVVDPGTADTHQYRFKCGTADWTAYGNSADHGCATTDNGTVVVNGQVRDDDGGESAEYSATVTVDNVAPTATFNAPESVNEGSDIDLSLIGVVDPGTADTYEFRFSCDNGDTWTAWSSAASHSCTTNDNGTRSVKGQVRDDDGGASEEYSASVTVDNVAPSATFNAPESVNEGTSIEISLSGVVDPGSADTHEYRFKCGAGDWTAYGTSASHSCPTSDNGTVVVMGQARDDDGGTSEAYSDSVTVNNIAPTATFGAPESVSEGTSVAISLTNPSDPSSVDTAAGFEHRFSCDNGDTWTDWGAGNEQSCPTTDNGTKNVKGEIRDKDGGTSTYGASVTVINVAPSATFNAPESVNEGSDIDLTLTGVVDPGSADTHEFRFSCDGGDTWSPWGNSTHACPTSDNGTIDVRGQVRDDDGGTSDVYSDAVTVSNVAPSATFNAPASVNEASDINLSLSDVVDPGSADLHEFRFSCDGGTTWTAWSSTASHSCATNDNGTRSVKGQVRDDDGGESEVYSASVTVNNVAPTATFTAPGSVDEGSSIGISLTSPNDPSSVDTAAGFQYRFSCDDGNAWTDWSASNEHSCPTTDNGTRNVKGEIRDKDGGVNTYGAAVTVNNVAPTATFNAPASVNEGSDIDLSLTAPSDPSSFDTAAGFEYAFDCGSGYGAYSSSNTRSCATSDNGTRNVGGKVRDKDGAVTEYTASVAVSNVPPTLTSLMPGAYLVLKGSPVTVTGTYTDPGTGDTFTCIVNWDEPTGTPESIAGGSTSCSAGHTYTAQGTYTVSMKVRDDDGGESSTLTVIITVYDPGAGGFVTGGGWINSPAGSYAADPTASGRANFGFNSQYKKGATVPTGQTEFQLHFATFNFHSEAYEALVVSGHKAQYRGTGKVNGGSGFKFILTAYDGNVAGGGGTDRFRIKITRSSDNVVVYDTKMGTSDDMDLADPLAIGGGSIVIHKAK